MTTPGVVKDKIKRNRSLAISSAKAVGAPSGDGDPVFQFIVWLPTTNKRRKNKGPEFSYLRRIFRGKFDELMKYMKKITLRQ